MYNAIKETISVIYETSAPAAAASRVFFFCWVRHSGRRASPNIKKEREKKKLEEKERARVSMCFFNVEGEDADEWGRSVAVDDNRRHEFFGATLTLLAVRLSIFCECKVTKQQQLNYKSRARDHQKKKHKEERKKKTKHTLRNKMAATIPFSSKVNK